MTRIYSLFNVYMAISGFSSVLGFFASKSIYFYIFLFLSLAVFSVAAYFIYQSYVLPFLNPSYVANKEFVPKDSGSGKKDKKADMMFFFAEWCPHCKTAKPEWEKMKAAYANRSVNGYEIQFIEINCTNETPEVKEMLDKYNVEGFPTIKLVKENGEIVEYDAKVKFPLMEQFVHAAL